MFEKISLFFPKTLYFVKTCSHVPWFYFYTHLINHISCVSPSSSNFLHVLAMLNAKEERTRRTSDISAAASSLHQIQRDPQIDVRLTERVYTPDRILEWTFPSSVRHRQGPLPLVFSVERHREKIKTWAELTGCWSHGFLHCLHLEPVSDLILRGWLWWELFWYADNRWQGMMQISLSEVVGIWVFPHWSCFNLTFI